MSANAPAAASAPRNSRNTSYSGSRPTIRASRSLLACTAPLSQTADPQRQPVLARPSQLPAAAHRRCVEDVLASADSYETLAQGQPESRCRPLLLDESGRANRPSQHCRDGRGPGVRQRAIGSRLAPASVERQQRRRRYRVPCSAVTTGDSPVALEGAEQSHGFLPTRGGSCPSCCSMPPAAVAHPPRRRSSTAAGDATRGCAPRRTAHDRGDRHGHAPGRVADAARATRQRRPASRSRDGRLGLRAARAVVDRTGRAGGRAAVR